MKTNINLLVLLVVLLSMSACHDQLEIEPISSIGEDTFFETPEEVNTAVIGLYDALQQSVKREFTLTEMRSDNTRSKSGEGDWAQFEVLKVAPTNGAIASYWSDEYTAIFRANKVLETLEVVTDSADHAHYLGEALFVRALAHFNLTRAFGDIPYAHRVFLPGEVEFYEKESSVVVLDSVVSDLSKAVEVLPSRNDIAEGRATAGAAKTLLARVHLWRHEYAAARVLIEELLADSDYALVDDYGDVFYDELNSELIFVIQYVNDNVVESQDFSYEFTTGGSIQLNFITDEFEDFAEERGDTERAAIWFNPTNNATIGKYLTSSTNSRYCGNDWIVFRLADVYLMHVEAILAGAESTADLAAIGSYNTIRLRAGLTGLAVNGSELLTKQMLLDERRAELAFENHRYYDLVRMGEVENVMNAFALENGFSINPNKFVLPIPQREINTSEELLKQNIGY